MMKTDRASEVVVDQRVQVVREVVGADVAHGPLTDVDRVQGLLEVAVGAVPVLPEEIGPLLPVDHDLVEGRSEPVAPEARAKPRPADLLHRPLCGVGGFKRESA
jgi:hypothetical protein